MATDTTGSGCKKVTMPWWVILAPIIYAITLVTLALTVRHTTELNVLGFHFPASVPWFGMLGGALASFLGICYYNRDWNHGFDHWHFGSGLAGAAYGLFGYLVVIAGVNSSGATLPAASSSSASAFYAVVAFVVGYGQQHVHAMVEQIFSAIFQKPKDAQGPDDAATRDPLK